MAFAFFRPLPPPLYSTTLIIVLFLLATALAAIGGQRTESLASSVFRFIYGNERICGDMFADPVWLPAHQNCALKCRMDSEMCQMSSQAVAIRRQRCLELPVECRRRLKQMLGGAELFTKPRRGESPLGAVRTAAKALQSVGLSQKGKAEKRPLMTANLLTPAAKLRSSMAAQKEDNGMSNSRAISTTSSSSFRTMRLRKGSGKSRERELPLPPPPPPVVVDDRLEKGFQELYVETASVTVPSSISSSSPLISTRRPLKSTITVPPPPKSSSPPARPSSVANSPTPAAKSVEWKSAELGQIFAGNPFVEAVPIRNAGGDQSVLAVPPESQFIQQQQQFPTPAQPTPSEFPGANEEQEEDSTKVQQQQEMLQLVFGPPLSREQLAQGQQPVDKQPQMLAIPAAYFATASSSSTTTATMPGEEERQQEEEEEKSQRVAVMAAEAAMGGGRQMPWWSWRDLAEAMRAKPFYNGGDVGGISEDILSLDKSARCCQWALDGLCDRSWQRVRELCPKSCGRILCSSIDGTLSCSRVINVDVIACYERRRHSLLTMTASAKQQRAQQHEDGENGMRGMRLGGRPVEMMAVEEEIKGFARQQQQKGLDTDF